MNLKQELIIKNKNKILPDFISLIDNDIVPAKHGCIAYDNLVKLELLNVCDFVTRGARANVKCFIFKNNVIIGDINLNIPFYIITDELKNGRIENGIFKNSFKCMKIPNRTSLCPVVANSDYYYDLILSYNLKYGTPLSHNQLIHNTVYYSQDGTKYCYFKVNNKNLYLIYNNYKLCVETKNTDYTFGLVNLSYSRRNIALIAACDDICNFEEIKNVALLTPNNENSKEILSL